MQRGNMRLFARFCIALLLALTVQTNAVTAQSNPAPKWSVNVMACVPNGSTIQNNLLQTSHGHARYTDGKTGNAYLICPFTDASLHEAVVSRIEMTFRTTSSSRVSAGLHMIDKRSGNVLDALGVSTGCLIDSTQLGDPYNSCSRSSNGHRLDFNRFYYYVQLLLYRSNAADDVRVVGTSIW